MTIRSALAAAAAAGCATAVTGALTASGATGPAEIRITDEALSRALSPPRNGGIAGTTEVIAQRLYNRRVANGAIGRSQIVCTYVDQRNRSCLSTYVLPKGSIVAAGAVSTRLLYDLPVVGGTGLYDNARGTVTVTATHVRPRREVLVFRLVG